MMCQRTTEVSITVMQDTPTTVKQIAGSKMSHSY
jgi:hypothetical protein